MTDKLLDKSSDNYELRSFGRVKGKALSPYQKELVDTLYPKIRIQAQPLDGLESFKEVWFEIGFGGAEHLIYQAEHNPNIAVLGAEPFLNGVAKALRSVADKKLENVRLLQGDAREVLSLLPDESLSRLFILFPDPWPKSKHNKRRIINESLIADIYRVLKPGSEFRFASDIIHYVDWTLWRVKSHGGFDMPHRHNADWRQRPDDWPQTRYEAKAIREGRPCHYFRFLKL